MKSKYTSIIIDVHICIIYVFAYNLNKYNNNIDIHISRPDKSMEWQEGRNEVKDEVG